MDWIPWVVLGVGQMFVGIGLATPFFSLVGCPNCRKRP